jgi:hypothetical protein
MAKKGRPFVYQSEEEKPVTVSLRLPHALYERAEQRIRLQRMTLTEAIKEALEVWLEKPTDPRDLLVSDDNTVIRELEEMVDAVVQRVLARERAAQQALDTPTATPAPPVLAIAYNDNTIIQEKAHRGSTPPPRQFKLTSRQVASLRAKRQRGAPIKALMEEYSISKATLFRYLQ